MDRRAQRCPERFILRAYSAGLVQPRMQEIVGALFDCAPCRRAWNAFQIDAVHDSVRAFANRLLAAESFSKRENHFADSGKDSFCAIRRSLGGCDGAGPTRQIDTFGFSLPLRFENAIVSYAIYLRQLIWSIDLAVLYPHPEKFFPFPIIAGCIALLMALSAIAIIYRNDSRFRSPAGFGLLACWSR